MNTNYFVDALLGATEFDWTLDGLPLNVNNDTIVYQFPNDGLYTLCVTSRNACDQALPTCQQVLVESIPITEIVDVFCEDECYEVAGETICQSGFYEFILKNIDGCDSIVTADLEELPIAQVFIDVNICEGDTLYIGPTPYTQTGIFQETLMASLHCDSIIDLDLFVIICNITSSDTPVPVICAGSETGHITFNVDNGTPPFTFNWENLAGTHSGNGNISDLGESVIINNIPKGTYLITIEDGFGNSDIIILEVTEPPVMSVDLIVSDHNGFNVSCEMGMDGTLEVKPSGGVPPYSYLWPNGQTAPNAFGLSATEYVVTITDAVGCQVVANQILTGPASIFFSPIFNNVNCSGFNTGLVSVGQVSGGVPPFTYSLNGQPKGGATVFDSLTAGDYSIEVMDGNGCTHEVMGIVSAAQIPIVELGNTITVSLGELISFNPSLNNIAIEAVHWQGSGSLSCTNCLTPNVLPLFDGQYFLEIISDDGCTGMDSVFVVVNKLRKIFAPNAFSPNFDGINDSFTLYGGVDVVAINRLQIFDRWGAVVFDKSDFLASEPDAVWEGYSKNGKMQGGVFTWVAEVAFIDGVVEQRTGDVVIVL